MNRNFPNFVESFMEYASFTQCPEKFLLWSCYSILAGALERKVWLSNGGTTFYPNMYVMLVGNPGSRKSTSAGFAVDLLRQVPSIHFMANRINEASFFQGLVQTGQKKKFEFMGESYQHSASFLYASEAATSFSEMYHGGGVITSLTDVFNCEPLGWHKNVGWSKLTIKDGWVTVYNPCFNMLACSTPVWFSSKIMSRSDAEAGFGSRLLLVVQKERMQREFGWSETTPANNSLKMRLIADLTAISKLKGPYEIDDSFRYVFKRLDFTHENHMSGAVISSLLMGYYERKLTHTVKLSMVIAASRSDRLVLSGQHLEEAWKLVSSLESQMIRAYEQVGNAVNGASISEELIDYCNKNGITQFTRSSLISIFKIKYPVREIVRAVDDLAKEGKVKYILTGIGLREPTFMINAQAQDQLNS